MVIFPWKGGGGGFLCKSLGEVWLLDNENVTVV